MRDLNLAMVMSLKDKLVGPLNRAIGQAERGLKGLERTATTTARSTDAIGGSMERIGRQVVDTSRRASQELRNLGQEAARAGRELGKLDRLRSGAGAAVRGITRGWAATEAFKHVVADPVRQAADYDMQLRMVTNTAYAGRSLAERRAGMGTINAGIIRAIRFGGGSREASLLAFNELVGSGQYAGAEDALSAMPAIMRASTASGAPSVDLARIAISAREQMGIKDAAGLQELLDRAMAAGQAGGFELRDMAKWLPKQMAAGKGIGLNGMSGMTQLLAANQAAVITAGTRDEAGNNLTNLLIKISSQDAKNSFAKAGIDLPGSLAFNTGKGINTLDAFVALVDKVVGSDPRFRSAQKAAMSAKGGDREAATQAQADLLQGSAIGQVVQDQQALMALASLMNNRAYKADVVKQMSNSRGSVDSAAALITEGAGFKFDQRQFEAQNAQTEALTGPNSALAKLAEAQIDLYQRYPGFAQAVEGARVAVSGLAAAAAGAGAANLLLGGRAAAASVAGSAAAGTAAGAAATAATGVLGLGAIAAVAAPMLAAANENRDYVEAVADPSMMGSADFASAMADRLSQPVKVNVAVHLDGRQIEAAVTTRQDQRGKRQ